MLKPQARELFKTLFTKASRTQKNWKEMLDSLSNEGEITERQAYKWTHFGTRPIEAK